MFQQQSEDKCLQTEQVKDDESGAINVCVCVCVCVCVRDIYCSLSYSRIIIIISSSVQCCFTSTETIIIKDC